MLFKKYFFVLGVLLVLMIFPIVAGADEISVEIQTGIPGTAYDYSPDENPSGIIGNLYQYALMLGGVLAFGVIVYGAVKYTMAAGNPSGQSDAKDIITQALLGLLLLVGGGLILSLLSPNFSLTDGNFTFPKIPEPDRVQAPTGNNTSGPSSCGSPGFGTCPVELPYCVNGAGGYSCSAQAWGGSGGPDGRCLTGQTQADCMNQAAPDGGYCDGGSCWRIGSPNGPFPNYGVGP